MVMGTSGIAATKPIVGQIRVVGLMSEPKKEFGTELLGIEVQS